MAKICGQLFVVYSNLSSLSISLINPRRMREGYCSHSVCPSVCQSVCYLANCYIPRLLVQIAML